MENWTEALEPLLTHYGSKKHPLDYENRYQLMAMVILSARDSDKHINKIAPSLFSAYPNLSALAKATPEDLHPYISDVTNFHNKAIWITEIAQTLGDDNKIPTNLEGLTKLNGIGRKSANVIIRESGGKAEGVVVDLHVVRVAPRIGIASGTNPEKIEKQLMLAIPDIENWNKLGMAISFLGREICRPTPKCSICMVNDVCQYYYQVKQGKTPEPVKKAMQRPLEVEV